jgi:hypothetical protein
VHNFRPTIVQLNIACIRLALGRTSLVALTSFIKAENSEQRAVREFPEVGVIVPHDVTTCRLAASSDLSEL